MNESYKQNNEFISEGNNIDLKEIFYILSTNIKLISFILFISIFLGLASILTTTPLYKSYGTVLVESNSPGLSLFSDFPSSSGTTLIDNEVEILRSKQTLSKTINYFIEDGSYKNMFLFGTRKYEHKGLSKFLRNILSVGYFDDDQVIDIRDEIQISNLVNSFKKSVVITKRRKADLIELSISMPDPYESSLIINRLIKSYQAIDREWSNGEMIHMRLFLDSQILIKEKELWDIEDRLSAFQKKEQIYGLSGNSELLLNQLTLVEAEYYSTRVEYNILKERKQYIDNQLTEEEKSLAEKLQNTINERLFALKSEVAQRESELTTTIALQGEEHQAVLPQRESIKKLKKKLGEETKKLISQGISVADPIQFRQSLMDTLLNITAQEASYISKTHELDKIIKKYETELLSLPDKSLQFARLERDRNILSKTYALMMQKREEAKIGEASKVGKIRIVDLATPELDPVKPKKISTMLLSLFTGIVLAVIICLIKEYFDNSIKSISEIERYDLEILGMIPTIGKNYKSDKISSKTKRTRNSVSRDLERRLKPMRIQSLRYLNRIEP